MKYKLLVLDIDGTVTNSDKDITEKTKNAIIKAQQNGVVASLASGRPYAGMVRYAKELELEKYGGYVLSYNGGRVVNCKTGETVFEKVIDKDGASEIYSLSKEFGVNIISYIDDYVVGEKMDKYFELECRINKLEHKLVSNLLDEIKTPVPKFLMLGDGDYLAKIEGDIKARLGEKYSVFRSEPFFLEIMPQSIDKAYSLNMLAKSLGIRQDEVIACGDGFNDLSMISYAGLGVAMENAQQSVKDVSDFITLSNNNDGIAHVVEKFILMSAG